MRQKKIFVLLSFCITVYGPAQPKLYFTASAHSHNDYEQSNPFYEAWNNGFGSIEADIFLHNDQLLVAHATKELNNSRTLQSLYLDPLKKVMAINHGYPYADTAGSLQLLVDVKTESVNTLSKLIKVLQNYPAIIHCPKIKIAISGNRPPPETFTDYPSYIDFDGVLSQNYPADALSKIVMLSDNFRNYSKWNGLGPIPLEDSIVLSLAVNKAHQLKKKVRFWNAPDNASAWVTFEHLKVDYINTDHIGELAKFFKKNE